MHDSQAARDVPERVVPRVETEGQKEMMSLGLICYHEQRSMTARKLNGYDQHDDHVWRWLNHHLAVWHARYPIKVAKK